MRSLLEHSLLVVATLIVVPISSFAAEPIANEKDCSRALDSSARPRLESVEIVIARVLDPYIETNGYTPGWIESAIRRSLREPLALESTGEPRFVLFLPLAGGDLARVEVFWRADTDTVVVCFFSPYKAARDKKLLQRYGQEALLRLRRVRVSIFDQALERMAVNKIKFSELEQALLHPLSTVVPDDVYPGQSWVVGQTDEGRRISIKFVQHEFHRYIKAVAPASPESCRTYFRVAGNLAEESCPKLTITRGPFKFRPVSYGNGLDLKINNLHHLTRAQLEEAFEISRGGVPKDDGRAPQGRDPRYWFVARLSTGQLINIVYAQQKNGQAVIITAHETNEHKATVYNWLVKEFKG